VLDLRQQMRGEMSYLSRCLRLVVTLPVKNAAFFEVVAFLFVRICEIIHLERQDHLQTKFAVPTVDQQSILEGMGAFPNLAADAKVLGCLFQTAPVVFDLRSGMSAPICDILVTLTLVPIDVPTACFFPLESSSSSPFTLFESSSLPASVVFG
jgi:hypothetical protein